MEMTLLASLNFKRTIPILLTLIFILLSALIINVTSFIVALYTLPSPVPRTLPPVSPMPISTEAFNETFPSPSRSKYMFPSFYILYSCRAKYSLTVVGVFGTDASMMLTSSETDPFGSSAERVVFSTQPVRMSIPAKRHIKLNFIFFTTLLWLVFCQRLI